MKLVIGIPSKGRLKEKTLDVFSRALLPVTLPEDDRNYRGQIQNLPGIEIAFLSASEIARELAIGNIHAGITGEDLVRENIAHWSEKVELAAPLGFGHADVVVGVPQAWIDVENMADLSDVASEFRLHHGRRLRIATKYWRLTQGFFADHGIALYRIIESLGATEGAPAAGQADIIVDITSTGSTLVANQLKVPKDAVVLKSQANLAVSRKARWSSKTGDLMTRVKEAIQAIDQTGQSIRRDNKELE
jgi:ATP phosphoribosyltransferase